MSENTESTYRTCLLPGWYLESCRYTPIESTQVATGRPRTIIDGKFQALWFQGPLIPPHVAVEYDSLPSDDDMTSSDNVPKWRCSMLLFRNIVEYLWSIIAKCVEIYVYDIIIVDK